MAHTSTTVLLKILLDRGEGGSLHARIGLAVSIMQDLSVIWMIVLIPLLAGEEAHWESLVETLLQGVATIVLMARYLLPELMFQVVRLHNRELFMIVVALICLGTAWLTAQAGLSLALGAFLAGVALAESEYTWRRPFPSGISLSVCSLSPLASSSTFIFFSTIPGKS